MATLEEVRARFRTEHQARERIDAVRDLIGMWAEFGELDEDFCGYWFKTDTVVHLRQSRFKPEGEAHWLEIGPITFGRAKLILTDGANVERQWFFESPFHAFIYTVMWLSEAGYRADGFPFGWTRYTDTVDGKPRKLYNEWGNIRETDFEDGSQTHRTFRQEAFQLVPEVGGAPSP